MLTYLTPGKLAATYPVRQTGQARAAFLFRRDQEFDYDHRDLDHQRQLLHEVYAGEGWEVPRLLAGMNKADDFYFDSISQIIMDHWSDRRITLVGDAAYSPARPSVAAPASPSSAPTSSPTHCDTPARPRRRRSTATSRRCASSSHAAAASAPPP